MNTVKKTNMMEKTNAHDDLVWLFKNSGLTLRELSLMFGVSRHTIHAWVYGRTITQPQYVAMLRDIVEAVKSVQQSLPPTTSRIPENVREALFTRDPETGVSVVGKFRRMQTGNKLDSLHDPSLPEEKV